MCVYEQRREESSKKYKRYGYTRENEIVEKREREREADGMRNAKEVLGMSEGVMRKEKMQKERRKSKQQRSGRTRLFIYSDQVQTDRTRIFCFFPMAHIHQY